MKHETIMVTAYSNAPKNTSMYENNKVYGLILEIDKKSHVIVGAEATVLTELAKNFLNRMLVGVDFSKDIKPVIDEIQSSYFAPSQNAMIVALKTAHQRYADNCL